MANGDLRVEVPEDIGARIFYSNAEPTVKPNAGQTYSELIYRVELEGNDYVLVARDFDEQGIKMRYRLNVPTGSLRIESGE